MGFALLHLEQVCADLKIQLIFSLVGTPRGRGRVERFFNTVNQELLSRLPGYAPAGFASQATPVLDLNALTRAFAHFVLHDYHQRPHSATGIAPQARWSANGFLPQLPESFEQLDLLLLTVATPRSVHRDGIRFQGLRYIDTTLAAYVGERVTVRYDPRDMAEIRVYYRDGFLCRAVCQELAGETVSLKAIVQARRQRKRALHQHLRMQQSLVEQLLGVAKPTAAPRDTPPPAPAVPAPPSSPTVKRYHNE